MNANKALLKVIVKILLKLLTYHELPVSDAYFHEIELREAGTLAGVELE